MHIPGFMDDLRSIREENLHVAMMALPIIGILVFTIVPLVFMILIAFTSYDHEHQPPGNLFTWVGLANSGKQVGGYLLAGAGMDADLGCVRYEHLFYFRTAAGPFNQQKRNQI